MIISAVKIIDDLWMIPFQWISDQYAHLTGREHFDLARLMAVAYPGGFLSYAINADESNMYWAIFGTLALMITPLMFFTISNVKKAMERGFQNPERISPFSMVFRYIQGIFVVGAIIRAFTGGFNGLDVSIIALWAHCYFVAASLPPPPQEAKDLVWTT